MGREDETSRVIVTSWEGEFPRKAIAQASDRSGSRRQLL